jgi:hypothetical protein
VKTWGFHRYRKASRPEGRPKPRRVAKRSAQPTNPKEPATDVRWGENLGVPEGTQGESARGAPKTEASRQEGRATNKTRKSQRQRCGGEKTWGFQRERKASWPNGRPKPKQVFNRSAKTQHKASSRDGRPNEKLVRNKGALGKKTSWRMDKNKFWLGGRLFNTASPRLGAPTQRKARPQDGRPNATQGASARWAPKRKTDRQRKRPHKGALG